MELSRYDPQWPALFVQERGHLEAVFGQAAKRIEHVGSTSVPGLQAKPVIDIQISLDAVDVGVYAPLLAKLDYKHLPMEDPPPDVYPFFHKPARWPTTHHVHLCKSGSWEERSHLAFRDWLRLHPDDRDAYGDLKDRLALQVDDKDVNTLFAYTQDKTEFVQRITAQAVEAGLGV